MLQTVMTEQEQLGLDPDVSAPQVTALQEMRNCLPAASIWHPAPLIKTTCRKYAVCPWCRYRIAESVILKLAPHLHKHKYVANTTLSLPWDYARGHRRDVAYFLHRLCNRNRRWPQDVVMTVPAYGIRPMAWFLHISIVALADDVTDMDDPESLVDLLAWSRRDVPPIGGTQWNIEPATKKALYNAVAYAARYSANLLYTSILHLEDGVEEKIPMDTTTFLEFANTTALYRTKFHGLR
jgi:hypothetical protein